MISPYAFPGMIDKPVGKIEFEDIESKVCELFNTTVDKLLEEAEGMKLLHLSICAYIWQGNMLSTVH